MEQQDFDSNRHGTDDGFFDHPWGHHRPTGMQALLIGLTRRTILQRGRLRHRMTNLITGMGRPLDITFRGCNWRIAGRNNLIEYGMLTRPVYNAKEIDFLLGALRPGGVALDIGCNIGLYSLPMAKAVGPEGRVLSIDANGDMIRHLEFNAGASGLENVLSRHNAVGAEEAMVDLEIRLDDVAIVNVRESDAGKIAMRPLLDIVREAGITAVDALKIDIEGHEDAALVPYLQQAEDALLPKRIVIEYSSKTGDYPGCAAEFKRLGYVLRGRTKINALFERG